MNRKRERIERGLTEDLSSFFGCTTVDLGIDTSRLTITLRDLRCELRGMLSTNEVHGASAETAASHTSAAEARETPGSLHHDVELAAADFVEVAEALMRFTHEVFHFINVACSECTGRIGRTLVFADNMATSFPNSGWQIALVPIEHVHGNIA